MKFGIIKTGVANLASVQACFKRLQISTEVVESPLDMDCFDAVVLPGVGAFDAGIDSLKMRGWDKFLTQRFLDNKPTLAICLGMQLLCQTSEESNSNQKGLGILPGGVVRFPSTVTVPQFGWNLVSSRNSFFKTGYTYFANSYCLPASDRFADEDWQILECNHGVDFVAAAQKGAWLACQFHPELSSTFGADLIKQWIDGACATSNIVKKNVEAEQC